MVKNPLQISRAGKLLLKFQVSQVKDQIPKNIYSLRDAPKVML